MKRLLLISVFMGSCFTSGLSHGALVWHVYGEHEYALTSDYYSTWLEADVAAASLGGHLVSITSSAEQDFINAIFLSGSHERDVYWIGINDLLQEGSYIWSSGESVTFSNWAPGEPDNYGSGQDYSIINWQYTRGYGARGDWSDTYVNGEFGWGAVDAPYRALVEVVPEPTTILLLGLGSISVIRRRRSR